MHLVISVNSVPYYFGARFCAATELIGDIVVISSANEGDFAEFVSDRRQSYLARKLFNDRSSYERGIETGEVLAKMHLALDDIDPDVIAVAGWSFSESLAAILWAKQRGRCVVMMSDSQRADGSRFTHREFVKSRVVRACDAALVGGRPHADYVAELGMGRAQLFLGYDVVDNDHFSRGATDARGNAQALREEHGFPARFLLASARFILKKNLPALVAAYSAATQDRSSPPHLVILGDGRERAAIEAAVESHGVAERIHLPGFRGYDVLPIFYGLAEGFIHVSMTEQWGLVVNEALASGLPVIVSRPCGAAAELVIDGVNGFLVDPASVEGMSAAIAALIDMPSDARARMGAASRRTIADWGPDRFASGLKSAAQAALAAPVRRVAPWDAKLLRALSRRNISSVE